MVEIPTRPATRDLPQQGGALTKPIIWTYWHQGWESAPSLVQQCNRSWTKWNPEYQVHSLDRHSLFDYVDLSETIDVERKDLTVQKISALGRLALLSKYGGVWADATVFCVRPLNEWLDQYFTSQFFAFRSPGKDRLMSNWFMAAEPDSLIIQRLSESFTDYYASNYFSNQDTMLGRFFLRCFNRRWSSDVGATMKWHSWFACRILRVYPYFVFHYTFNKLILTDSDCATLWNEAKPLSAVPPHRLQRLADSSIGVAEARNEITARLVHMYKLDWRVDSSSSYWSGVLRHLEEHE